MNQIYNQHLWGGNNYDFYSGEGSHRPEIIVPYIEVVIKFLESLPNLITVCDLGCGDFNIGKHLIPYCKSYIAVDIVDNLIDRNRKKFNIDGLKFLCIDISKDELPYADCAILRNVLQHLSNAEIQKIIKKLVNYKYIILTEHIPSGKFTANTDIISGQGIRLKKNSGVNLLESPFNLKVKATKQFAESILENQKGQIITTLYQLF